MKEIIEREEELFNFISKECKTNLEERFLNLLDEGIYNSKINKEFKKVNEYSKEILKKLSEISPMMYENFKDNNFSKRHCLDAYIFSSGPSEEANQNGEPICWKDLTYKIFEEEGFSKDFAKRVIKKLLEEQRIIRIKHWGIYYYNVYDFYDEINNFEYSIPKDREISKEEMKSLAEEIKKHMIESI